MLNVRCMHGAFERLAPAGPMLDSAGLLFACAHLGRLFAMNPSYRSLGLALLLLASSPAWAIHKCIGPDGRVSFQDAPCPGQGEQIELPAPNGPLPGATPPAAAPTGKKTNIFGEDWQRRTYLENRGVPEARADIDRHLAQCAAQQKALASQRGAAASNDVAEATRQQAISAEMQAAATACQTRATDLREELRTLEQELRELRARERASAP